MTLFFSRLVRFLRGHLSLTGLNDVITLSRSAALARHGARTSSRARMQTVARAHADRRARAQTVKGFARTCAGLRARVRRHTFRFILLSICFNLLASTLFACESNFGLFLCVCIRNGQASSSRTEWRE